MALSTKKSNDKRKADKEDKELKEVQPPRKKLVGASNEELKAMDPINDPVDPPAVPAPVRYIFIIYQCDIPAVDVDLRGTFFDILPRELLPLILEFALEALWHRVYDKSATYIEIVKDWNGWENRYNRHTRRYDRTFLIPFADPR